MEQLEMGLEGFSNNPCSILVPKELCLTYCPSGGQRDVPAGPAHCKLHLQSPLYAQAAIARSRVPECYSVLDSKSLSHGFQNQAEAFKRQIAGANMAFRKRTHTWDPLNSDPQSL